MLHENRTKRVFTLSLMIFFSSLISAKDYFVATDGSDNASGSKKSPWKTIQKAASSASAGDDVYVRGGTYNEMICIEGSGEKDEWITFQPFEQEKVIVDASGIKRPKSKKKNVEGSAVFYISKSSYIRISGFELCNATVNGGGGIWVYGSGDHIELLDNHIHDIKGKHAMGITIYGTEKKGHTGIRNLLIHGNHIHDCEPATSETLVINGDIKDFKILNNDIHDVNNIGIDVIGGEKWLSKKFPSNGVIANNRVRRCFSSYEDGYAAAIYSDGASDLLIENNAVSESDIGMEIGAENKGVIVKNVIVRGNLIFNNYKAGIGFGGYNKKKTGFVEGIVIENNIFYKNNRPNDKGPYPMSKGADNGEIWVQWSKGSHVKNNIVQAREGVDGLRISWDKGYDEGNFFENNTYFTSDGADNAIFVFNGKEISGFDTYKKSGLEKNPKFRDPKLTTAILEEKAEKLLMEKP